MKDLCSFLPKIKPCADVSEDVVLQAMRKGLLDVLPKNALEDLTAEDFRLLVNGCGEVNVQMLISFTSFNDESGTLLSLIRAVSPSLIFVHFRLESGHI